MTDGEHFAIRSKIWLVDASGDVVFGLGRLKILEAVQRNGSINAAAKALKMSYRGVWGRIRATEERLGRPLLIKNIGGASGGGSELTPFALSLMEMFREAQGAVINESDRLFEARLADLLSSPDPTEGDDGED